MSRATQSSEITAYSRLYRHRMNIMQTAKNGRRILSAVCFSFVADEVHYVVVNTGGNIPGIDFRRYYS